MYQLRCVSRGRVIRRSAWFTAKAEELTRLQEIYLELHPECQDCTVQAVKRSAFWGKLLNFLHKAEVSLLKSNN